MGKVFDFQKYKNQRNKEHSTQEWQCLLIPEVRRKKLELIQDVQESHKRYLDALTAYYKTVRHFDTLVNDINNLKSTFQKEQKSYSTSIDELVQPLSFLEERDQLFIKEIFSSILKNENL